ncbi:MAG: hypothetical protein QNJ63_02725 [Calothrix sp. MO_192.B10]|nr:hypothetical protein [Calothrix sp. MO_192.B10]
MLNKQSLVNTLRFWNFSQISTLGKGSSVVNEIDVHSDHVNGGVKLDANLFHSFREFNVGQDRGVYFVNPEVITEYILSRYKFHPPRVFQN